MHQPKKRWARTAAQQRHDQRGRSYWHRPKHAGSYTRWARQQHRAQTKRALARIRKGMEEEAAGLPFQHRHWLTWWWC